MNWILSGLLLVVLTAAVLWVLRRKKADAPAAQGTALEYRTALPLDACLDALAAHSEEDVFAYTCQREPDGGFALHLTLHNATRQPLDTRYRLRLEAGRETALSLFFVSEAWGYGEPVFPPELMDAFLQKKLQAHRVPGLT